MNTPGTPEIPEVVFEELLVNALAHRDYLVSAPIRIFIFDNRIEIISPGHLPNNLTVEKIRTGNSNIRNPILVSYIAKGLLPYHGLGSGIKRALENWPNIEFADDRDGYLFTATVQRKPVGELSLAEASPNGSEKSPEKTDTTSVKTSVNILAALKEDRDLSIPGLASMIGVTTRSIERNIQRLQKKGRLRRIGPDKGGRWEVIE
jgi:ATP-dependent DNA helicase RecG